MHLPCKTHHQQLQQLQMGLVLLLQIIHHLYLGIHTGQEGMVAMEAAATVDHMAWEVCTAEACTGWEVWVACMAWAAWVACME